MAPTPPHMLLPSLPEGARIIQTAQEPIPTEAAAIKTMVLVVDDLGSTGMQQQLHTAPAMAVAVLLLAGHRVDLRAVAQHLQLSDRTLRLASPEEAVRSTGFELGCIPPLGEPPAYKGSLAAVPLLNRSLHGTGSDRSPFSGAHARLSVVLAMVQVTSTPCAPWWTPTSHNCHLSS